MRLIKRYSLTYPKSALNLRCMIFEAKDGIYAVCLELGLLSPASKTAKAAMQDLNEMVAYFIASAAAEKDRGKHLHITPAQKKYWDLYLKGDGALYLMKHSRPILPTKLPKRKLPELSIAE